MQKVSERFWRQHAKVRIKHGRAILQHSVNSKWALRVQFADWLLFLCVCGLWPGSSEHFDTFWYILDISKSLNFVGKTSNLQHRMISVVLAVGHGYWPLWLWFHLSPWSCPGRTQTTTAPNGPMAQTQNLLQAFIFGFKSAKPNRNRSLVNGGTRMLQVLWMPFIPFFTLVTYPVFACLDMCRYVNMYIYICVCVCVRVLK